MKFVKFEKGCCPYSYMSVYIACCASYTTKACSAFSPTVYILLPWFKRLTICETVNQMLSVCAFVDAAISAGSLKKYKRTLNLWRKYPEALAQNKWSNTWLSHANNLNIIETIENDNWETPTKLHNGYIVDNSNLPDSVLISGLNKLTTYLKRPRHYRCFVA